ncbi:uncharacterized protein LOC129000086 [Macrosteles quadrilineatus]|uniref:uncharacterized protein LOC129000086 n=1 Tax=Macrosteles quadrilineatus TaxID=74068 RepID=UPI0023E0CA22|nr:uncharacterized protein LOC129000086 [Macrosteles quadrilineatus]XP_054282940.1 uncharacterized protein LOC129000086 [Macrosteles quadrilineatus]
MVTTSNCCFCFSVRTGTLIIGWFHTVFGILNVAANITTRSTGQQSELDSTADGSWSSIIYACLQVLVAVGLLYGVYTHHRKTVYFYVFLQAALIVINIIMVIVLLIYAAFSNVAMVITSSIIVWLIQTYLVVVVYSFYKEMEDHM